MILADFINNRVNANTSGGAIFFRNVAEGNTFEGVFRNNTAGYGGAIMFYNKANNNKLGSDFVSNVASSSGGAIVFRNTTDNNTFTGDFIDNSALGAGTGDVNGNGGAITFRDVSTNCTFSGDFIINTAAEHGGAVNYRQTPHDITFNGDFIGNDAKYGGGVDFYESMDNVVFNGVFSVNSAEYGGAIAAKDGVIKNVSFKNNKAKYGGAIYFDSEGLVNGSEFINNTAEDGGAILSCGNLTVANSEFADNVATLGTNQISLKGNATITLINDDPEELGPFYTVQLRNISVSNITYGGIVNISADVVDRNNVPLNEGTLSVVINGITYSADVSDGTATILIPGLDVGNYAVDLTYQGNESYANSPVTFSVLKQNAKIIANNRVYVINYGGKYNIYLRDVNNNAIVGKKVTFKLNGKNIGSATTNAKGFATVKVNAKVLKTLKVGTKKLVISFADSNYNTVSKTVTVKINKERPRFYAKNKIFKKAVKVKKYAVIFKNSKGKVLKNAFVYLKVNGKLYKTRTNSYGKAIFNIKVLNKYAKYIAVVKYGGNPYYMPISKKVILYVKK